MTVGLIYNHLLHVLHKIGVFNKKEEQKAIWGLSILV